MNKIFPSPAHNRHCSLTRLLSALVLSALMLLVCGRYANAQVVSTLAGTGAAGFANGAGATAQFNSPTTLCADAAGNIYVTDQLNHRIRKIDISGNVTTYAGSGAAGFANGAAATAQFNAPTGIFIDATGNIYVSDVFNHRIRKIDIGGNVTTIAGSGAAGFANGAAATAQFDGPEGIYLDAAGNVYVADRNNHRIRKIDIGGNVTTLAGSGAAGFANGAAATAQFNFPGRLWGDAAGNIYVADVGNHRIRMIDVGGNVTTYAGSGAAGFANGAAATAQFSSPGQTFRDAAGNTYVADQGNNRIRKIDASGNVTTYAGTGTAGFVNAAAATAQFNNPTGVCTDAAENIYVADYSNHSIRKITPSTPPAITSFTPAFGGAGTTIVITGFGFVGTTAVSVGGVPVASFTVNSNTQITAVLGSGTPVTGGLQRVVVTAPLGTLSLGGFFVGGLGASAVASSGSSTPQSAIIINFSPSFVGFGTPITLTGSGFTGATGLLIGGHAVTNFTVVNDNLITAVVGGVPTNDRVTLVGGLGANLSMGGLGITYTALPAPILTSISPTSIAASGDDASLVLTGANFRTGVRVLIRDASADANTASVVATSGLTLTQITATLPAALRSSGTKVVTFINADGQAASINLNVTIGAGIALSASSRAVFTTTASGRAFSMTLAGTNIFRTVRATLNGAEALVSAPTSTQAIVEVPASLNDIGGINLTLRLVNSDGQSTSTTVRIERRPLPTILAVTLQGGGKVRVRGINFMANIRAALANTPMTILTQESDTVFTAQISASFRLGANTPTLSLLVQNPDGASHGVLLPRSLFEMASAGISSANGVSTERTWEAGAVAELLETQAGKQVQGGIQELSIYPNPVEGELRIGGTGTRTVRAYDMRGGVVLEERTVSGVVNVSGLPTGAYTVVVETVDGRVVRQRVVKK